MSEISPYGFKSDQHSSHNQIARWVKKVQAKEILDIGCAGGFLALALGRKWKGKLIGIEGDPSWVKDANLTQYKKIYWLDLEKKDISKALGQPIKNFDAIVAADVLEHLEKPEKTLKEISEILKKGGYLMVSLPNINYFLVLIVRLFFPTFRMSKGPLDKTHKQFYSLSSAKKLLYKNGFKIIEMQLTPAPIGTIFEQFADSPFIKLFYQLNYFLAKLLPNFFAYQLLFLAQPDKEW